MDIIDSKPWGLGQVAGASDWISPTCKEAELISALDGRNPFAVGHILNHPSVGVLSFMGCK